MKELTTYILLPLAGRLLFCFYASCNATFPRYAIYLIGEMLVLSLLLILLNRKLRFFLIPILLAHTLQLTNLSMTGYWVDPNTLQNINEADSIGSSIYKIFFLTVGYSICWVPALFSNAEFHLNKKIKFSVLFGATTFFLLSGSPIRNLTVAISDAWTTLTFSISNNQSIRDYFLRHHSATYSIPNKYGLSGGGYNIILIFAEGTSSSIISKELMPNTAKFLSESLTFKNYYNHQAATFRGIRGTLISGFTYRGGLFNRKGFAEIPKNDIISLYSNTVESIPSILKQCGYQTVFISPHSKNEALATLMTAVGFEESITSNKFSGFESDEKMYEKIFSQAVQLNNNGRFFLSSYIAGTHHGLDSDNLKYGDGKNSYKNKFFNQDYWFGEFLKKFKRSPLSKNTFVILTSDHSTYPSSEFKKTFNISTSVFHDRIPLGIYGPGIKKGEVNSEIRNSLALAPTILDILNIQKYDSHFLGNSLFTDASKWERYCAQGSSTYYIEDDGTVKKIKDNEFSKMLKLFYSISG